MSQSPALRTSSAALTVALLLISGLTATTIVQIVGNRDALQTDQRERARTEAARKRVAENLREFVRPETANSGTSILKNSGRQQPELRAVSASQMQPDQTARCGITTESGSISIPREVRNRPDGLPWIYAPVSVHVDNGDLVAGIVRLEGKLDQVIARGAFSDNRAHSAGLQNQHSTEPRETDFAPTREPPGLNAARELPRSLNDRDAERRTIHMSGNGHAPSGASPAMEQWVQEEDVPSGKALFIPGTPVPPTQQSDPDVATELFPRVPESGAAPEDDGDSEPKPFRMPELMKPEPASSDLHDTSVDGSDWDLTPSSETGSTSPRSETNENIEGTDLGWVREAPSEAPGVVRLTSGAVSRPAALNEPPAETPGLTWQPQDSVAKSEATLAEQRILNFNDERAVEEVIAPEAGGTSSTDIAAENSTSRDADSSDLSTASVVSTAPVAVPTASEPETSGSNPGILIPPVPGPESATAVQAASSTSVLPPEDWPGETGGPDDTAGNMSVAGQQTASPWRQPTPKSSSTPDTTSARSSGVATSVKRLSPGPSRRTRPSQSTETIDARKAPHATGKHGHSSHAASVSRRAGSSRPRAGSPLECATGDSQAEILLHRLTSTLRFASGPKALP